MHESGDDDERADAGDLAPPSRLPWPPILLLGLMLVGWLLGHAVPLPWPGLDDLPARAVGIGIGLAGLALLAWAAWTLHAASTTVRPDRAASTLVTTGPYYLSRNPIYLADAMILLGLAELTKNVWLVAAAVTFMVLITPLAVVREERHLAARFGARWDAYKDRVRRWL